MVERHTKEKFKDTSRHVTEHITELVQTYYRLGLLHLADKGSAMFSASIVLILTGLLSLFVVFFIGMGLGFWLGKQLDNMLAGFLLVAAAFLLLAMFIFLTRNRFLIPFLRDRIISKVYEQKP